MAGAFVERRCDYCGGTGELYVLELGNHVACQKCNGTGSVGSYEVVPELPQTEPTEFGKWMRDMHLKLGVTYMRLGELTGITPSRLSEIERGAGEPVTEAEERLVRIEFMRIDRDIRKAKISAEVDAEIAEEDRQRQIRKAAPDLLAALNKAVDALERADDSGTPGLRQIIAEALDAIAKAEGRE